MRGTDSPTPSLGDSSKQQSGQTSNKDQWQPPSISTKTRCSSPSTMSTASSSAYSTCSDTAPVLVPKLTKHHPLTRRNTSPIRYVPNTKAMVNLDMTLDRHIGEKRSQSFSRYNKDEYSPVRAYIECLTPQSLKCVLVGDSGVGKTSMLMNYTTETVIKQHLPTIYDKFTTSLSVNGRRISVTLCDTSGSDDFGHLRPLCYPQADVALICFSVVDNSSLENAKTKWIREIKRHCPHVPVVLVGTHTDKRDSGTMLRDFRTASRRCISRAEGSRVAASMKATYVECSSRCNLDVKAVFDEAISASLELGDTHKKAPSQCIEGCTIL